MAWLTAYLNSKAVQAKFQEERHERTLVIKKRKQLTPKQLADDDKLSCTRFTRILRIGLQRPLPPLRHLVGLLGRRYSACSYMARPAATNGYYVSMLHASGHVGLGGSCSIWNPPRHHHVHVRFLAVNASAVVPDSDG